MIAFCVATSVSLSIVFWFFKRRHKRKRIGFIAQRIKLEFELAELTLFGHTLSEKTQLRDQQMVMVKRTVEKRYQLQEYVRSDFDRLKKEHPNDVRSRLTELNSRINEAVDENTDDWKNFEEVFESVYPRYLQNFATAFPELNVSELRLCALLKLNLETKQIANILNVTNEGAKVLKYKLRKKLKLAPDENLIVFFNSI